MHRPTHASKPARRAQEASALLPAWTQGLKTRLRMPLAQLNRMRCPSGMARNSAIRPSVGPSGRQRAPNQVGHPRRRSPSQHLIRALIWYPQCFKTTRSACELSASLPSTRSERLPRILCTVLQRAWSRSTSADSYSPPVRSTLLSSSPAPQRSLNPSSRPRRQCRRLLRT